MRKLRSIDEFKALCDRLAADSDPATPVLIISAGTCGQASGANDLIRVAKRELLRRELGNKIALRISGCHGYCEMEPLVLVEPSNTLYPKVGMDAMERIIEAVANDEVAEELLYLDPVTGQRIQRQSDVPFFAPQQRTILARSERLDPIRIYNYVKTGGYGSLIRVFEEMSPRQVVDEISTSGLRGRGGAGFPTGRKWELLAARPSDKGKFLVCNADEGDPGAYMDRSILEGNPHSILEGMLIAAYATGATDGVIYVRNEYPLAIKHLVIALRQARELGLLGERILGSHLSFDIQLVRGAGAFVCGEETSLIASIEGRMGEPRQRPPFPIERGIDNRPTSINNVETWANIPVIIEQGAEAYRKVGTATSSGTKIFSLVGKVHNTGLVEVPMGTSIRDVVFGVGGGSSTGRPIKAVQTGGPSGGCIPAEMFDVPIDYDSLAKVGSIMGSGGMIVMDESTCVVDMARYYMGFLKDESCGKCFTCRKGTQRMYELLSDICSGRATLEHIDLLTELATVVKDTTMCGLGHAAPNPVLSTLRYFRDEYEEHVLHKRCRAGVCHDLVGAACQSSCPVGTEAWRYVAHIARGEYEQAYSVIRTANPFPSVCARVCHHPCELSCRLGATGDNPVAIRALKRFVTDSIDPATYTAPREATTRDARVAVVGAGPAGLTAAHYLSRMGYRVTVFEAEQEPGGMLMAGVPSYRLPRDVVRREIDCLFDDRVELRCAHALGTDFTIEGLFEEGYQSVFLAVGAHRSRRLGIDGEEADGIHPSMGFLRAFNLRGENVARGKVGVIGGGNSALDAARVAMRQPGVESVTIYYRRTRDEMPAFPEEIDAALEEGVQLETLVSPVAIDAPGGTLRAVTLRSNTLGDFDASGRRRPVEVAGSDRVVEIDTLIVAIGEVMQACLPSDATDIEMIRDERINADHHTLATSRAGVFAGGDAVTGPNTVIDAIAAGKRVAKMIDRYLKAQELAQPEPLVLPEVYVEPIRADEAVPRAVLPTEPIEQRRTSFVEVERTLSEEHARCEARRCLRCDLDFIGEEVEEEAVAEGRAG